MAVYVGSARIDENGKAYNGKAGDQTGKEVGTQKWYKHTKGWRVFRAKDRAVALKIAEVMDWACANKMIGYDQWNRHTLYNELARYDFAKMYTAKNVETDCSALVRVCLKFCGITVPEAFRTGNMPTYLLKTGAFVEMKGSKYTDQHNYLGRGDILVTKTNGHTVVVLDDGAKYEGDPVEKEYALGERILRNGDEGADVKLMQEYLIGLGYELGKWGADGDFGDATEIAVRLFQKNNKLQVDGEYGPKSHAALMDAVDAAAEKPANPVEDRSVTIEGGNCYVRKAPNTTADILGVAYKGESYPYQGDTAANGWHLIIYDNQNGWVSGKYGKLEG